MTTIVLTNLNHTNLVKLPVPNQMTYGCMDEAVEPVVLLSILTYSLINVFFPFSFSIKSNHDQVRYRILHNYFYSIYI